MMNAFAQAVSDRLKREKEIVPDSWTAIVECKHCGLVYLWHGLSKVLGCPWYIDSANQLPVPRPNKTENIYELLISYTESN